MKIKDFEQLTKDFLWEMYEQGIETLEQLFTNITDDERDKLVKIICSRKFNKLYNMHKANKKILFWEDLTEQEKEQAKETYISIREIEEETTRENIDADFVECCSFERLDNGYIEVII